MESVKMQPAACPRCGKMLDAATCVSENGATPEPGDYTVCGYCAAILLFTDDLGLRLLRKEDGEAPGEVMMVSMRIALTRLSTLSRQCRTLQ